MPVSFLDLVPKIRSEDVAIETLSHGRQEIELSGICIGDLAAVSKRFPILARFIDGAIDWDALAVDVEALVAAIAAAMGHCGDEEYEKHIARFPTGDVSKMALAVIRLTLPGSDDPLPEAAGTTNGVDVAAAALDQTSPLQLNS